MSLGSKQCFKVNVDITDKGKYPEVPLEASKQWNYSKRFFKVIKCFKQWTTLGGAKMAA